MEYTVQRLAKLAGVSGRTLRYYDEIGLLEPMRINSSGYRVYGREQVDRLQHILFYRELGVPLEEIRRLLAAPEFDGTAALREHLERLRERRAQIEALIANVERTLSTRQGENTMSDREKFEGFKKSLVDENERRFGTEARAAYGDQAVDEANRKLMGQSPEEYQRGRSLEQEVLCLLDEAFSDGDPAGERAHRLADRHREWLCLHWTQYTPQAHAGLAHMYVEDSRFADYYNRGESGKAEFLRDAILHYTGGASQSSGQA